MLSTQNTTSAGMFQDGNYVVQPEGSYPFALNAVNVSLTGQQGFLSSEQGTLYRASLPNGYYPIGAVNMLNDEVLVFSVGTVTAGSEIGIFNALDNSYTTVLNGTTCFNFNLKHQIQGVFKIRKGCNRTVYWTDDFNPIRVIDVDDVINNPTAYQDSGNWDCEKFALNPPTQIPKIDNLEVLDSGGSLRVGTYQLVFRYLDSDFNPSIWFDISHPIPIVDESYSSTPYLEIDGKAAVATNQASMDTTKSIRATLTNIDTDFRYIQLAAFEYTSVIANTPRVVLKPYSIITGSTMYITYSGFSVNGDEITDPAEIVVPPVTWERCKTMVQLDNQLILGNVKSKEVDFAEFQSAANDIQVNYITKALYEYDGPKYEGYYEKYRSLMRDEVYALGIIYIFNDGYETPVLHIPGRAKNFTAAGLPMPNTEPTYGVFPYQTFSHSREDFVAGEWDSSPTTSAGAPFDAVESNAAITARGTSNIERWMVYNTAHRTDEIDTTGYYLTRGECGYWESDLDYPDDLLCDGVTRVYPEGKIRHHKMPDTTLEPHFYGQSADTVHNPFADNTPRIVTLGLQFNNVAVPAAYSGDIQGYKIVISDRDGNRSVIDKGIFYKNLLVDETIRKHIKTFSVGEVTISEDFYTQASPFYYQRDLNPLGLIPHSLYDQNASYISLDNDNPIANGVQSNYPYPSSNNSDGTNFSFHAPLLKFKKLAVGVDHVKIERELAGDIVEYGDVGPSADSDDLYSFCLYNRSYAPSVTNRTISGYSYADADTAVPAGTLSLPFMNLTKQEAFVIDLLNSLVNPSNEVDSSDDRDGTRVSHCYYGSIKEYKTQQYGNIDQIKYILGSRNMHDVASTSVNVFPGDIFITKFNFRKTSESIDFDGDWDSHDGHMPEFWVESDINTFLRHAGDTIVSELDNCDDGVHQGYYQKYFGASDTATLGDFLGASYCHINYYGYNDNYSQRNTARNYFPLEQGFDYCSNCRETYPNRLAYSVKSSQEDRFDNYKLFLANNYKDTPQNTGEIINLFTKRSDLYIQTEQSLWVQKLNQLELNATSVENIQVGTGAEFSIPALELISTPTGYVGSQSQWATVATEAGVFMVNQALGAVFLFTDTVQEISKQGMMSFFKNKLKCSYKKEFFDLVGIMPPNLDNPANHLSGVGCHAVYDEFNKRFILTKRDYSFTAALTSAYAGIQGVGPYSIGDIVYNEQLEGFYRFRTLSQIDRLPFTDSTYFENKSFTVSFSTLTGSWTSFHSYTPLFFFSSRDKFFSTTSDDIHEHNVGNMATYYEYAEPFIVELVAKANPLQTQIWENFQYVQDSISSGASKVDVIDYQDLTFNKAIFYNARQSTGELALVVKPANDPFRSNSNLYSPTTALVERVERNWKINNFRDNVVQTNPEQSLFTADWTNATYQSQYPIDKVANAAVISSTKSQFELSRLRDKYLVARLIYDASTDRDKNITLRYSDTKFETSKR